MEKEKLINTLKSILTEKRKNFSKFTFNKNTWFIDAEQQIKTNSKKVEEKFYYLKAEIKNIEEILDIFKKM